MHKKILLKYRDDMNQTLKGIILTAGAFILFAAITTWLFAYEEPSQGTLTVTHSCLYDNGHSKEFYVIDNFVDESCSVNIVCYGITDYVMIMNNRFNCDGNIKLIFTNSTYIHITDSNIKHDIKFMDIDEFVFADTSTMDDITIRGD